MRIRYFILLFVFTILCPGISFGAETQPSRITLEGTVVDSLTGLRLEFITIQEKGTANGTITDTKGAFSITVAARSKVVISCVGYRTKEISGGRRSRNLTIQLAPMDMELSEVVVKPKRERYRRKDNPSVVLARNVIAHKNDKLPKERDYYSCERYDHMVYSLTNMTGSRLNMFRKKFDFIDQYIDSTSLDGDHVLPISSDETVQRQYYRKSPKSNKTELLAEEHAGLDDMMPEMIAKAMKSDIFPEVDIHDDNIYLFSNQFVSPLSSFAITFYKFYILDTLELEDGNRYIDLGFAPLLPQSLGFIGHLFISTDSTFFVKRAELNVPKDINLNWVKSMAIRIEQGRLFDSTQVSMKTTFDAEMEVIDDVLWGLFAHRTCYYSDYRFEDPGDRVWTHWGPVIESQAEVNASHNTRNEFFREHRPEGEKGVPGDDHSVANMLRDMRNTPFFYYTEQILTALFKGYISVGKRDYEENEFLYGPLNATASYTKFEGFRMRAGGITTARLNPHLFGFGYVAYGFGDHKWKGNLEAEYSFRKKKMHANEFPIHSVRAGIGYDTRLLGQDPTDNRDNFLRSFRNSGNDQITYQRAASLLYTKEYWNGLSIKLNLENTRDWGTSVTPFKTAAGVTVDHYDMSTATLTLRFSHNERFMQSRTSRISISQEIPVFTLSHSIAKRGVLGSDWNYQRTDFKYEQRWYLSAFGYVNALLQAGKVWTQSPFSMLCIPFSNPAFTIQKHTFSLMEPMEFVNDQYVQWDLVYFLNGLIFNNIPLMRRLKWREVVSFRGIYGSLSERNDPSALASDGYSLRNPDLYVFPSENKVYKLENEPYMEVAFGIENIFKILRVEYVRRLNYTGHPDVHKHGFQVGMHITF